MKYYSGIGSRETPQHICIIMEQEARRLDAMGYVLRSGGADGADTAFEKGATTKEIYIPWHGFNGRFDAIVPEIQKAVHIAKTIHPAWGAMGPGGKKLHARNVFQVLGMDLETPVEFVLFWSKVYKGEPIGGTRTAVMLARERNIPTFNLLEDDTLWKYREFIGVSPTPDSG